MDFGSLKAQVEEKKGQQILTPISWEERQRRAMRQRRKEREERAKKLRERIPLKHRLTGMATSRRLDEAIYKV